MYVEYPHCLPVCLRYFIAFNKVIVVDQHTLMKESFFRLHDLAYSKKTLRSLLSTCYTLLGYSLELLPYSCVLITTGSVLIICL